MRLLNISWPSGVKYSETSAPSVMPLHTLETMSSYSDEKTTGVRPPRVESGSLWNSSLATTSSTFLLTAEKSIFRAEDSCAVSVVPDGPDLACVPLPLSFVPEAMAFTTMLTSLNKCWRCAGVISYLIRYRSILEPGLTSTNPFPSLADSTLLQVFPSKNL